MHPSARPATSGHALSTGIVETEVSPLLPFTLQAADCRVYIMQVVEASSGYPDHIVRPPVGEGIASAREGGGSFAGAPGLSELLQYGPSTSGNIRH